MAVVSNNIHKIITWDEAVQFRNEILDDLRVDTTRPFSALGRQHMRICTAPIWNSSITVKSRLLLGELILPVNFHYTCNCVGISVHWVMRFVNNIRCGYGVVGPVESPKNELGWIRTPVSVFVRLANEFGIEDYKLFRLYKGISEHCYSYVTYVVCDNNQLSDVRATESFFYIGRNEGRLAESQQFTSCEQLSTIHFAYLSPVNSSNYQPPAIIMTNDTNKHTQWGLNIVVNGVMGYIKSDSEVAVVIIVCKSNTNPATKFLAEDLVTGEMYEVNKAVCCFIKPEIIDEATLIQKTCEWKARHDADQQLILKQTATFYQRQLIKKRKREQDEKDICVCCMKVPSTRGCVCRKGKVHFCYCETCYAQVKEYEYLTSRCPRCWNRVDKFLLGV